QLGPRGAQRALLPVAQASYSFNLGEHDTLSLALESRTLQPSVTFSHEAQGRAFPQTEIRGALTVGVAWSISPEAIDALALAQARFADAQARLAETRTRVDAGLATPLELQSDALAVTRAQLELRSASLNVLGTTLDLYELYALPLGTAPEAPAP